MGWFNGLKVAGTDIPTSSKREFSIRAMVFVFGTCCIRRKLLCSSWTMNTLRS
jgi:hypothetical protein